MKTVRAMLLNAVFWGGWFGVFDPALAQVWTQTRAPSNSWYSVASSADGLKWVAVCPNGIWITTNSGTTWTQTSATNINWVRVVSSADGTKLAAFETYTSEIYLSTDSGNTWAPSNIGRMSLSSIAIAISADGNTLAAMQNTGLINITTNSGTSWKTVTNTLRWVSVAMSADGTKMAASARSTMGIYGSLWASTNSGSTWTTINKYQEIWQGVASSANGNTLVAGCVGGIFTTTNRGYTWSWFSVPNQNNELCYVTSSADGSKLDALMSDGRILVSTNSGVNWTSNNVVGAAWLACASSADGNTLVAINGARIWTTQTPPVPFMGIAPTDGSLALSWTIPSTNFILQQSADLTAWADVTNLPVLNLTNLHNEVTLPPSGNSGFYRLRTP